MRKRVVAVLLSALMATGMLAGCGNGKSSAKNEGASVQAVETKDQKTDGKKMTIELVSPAPLNLPDGVEDFVQKKLSEKLGVNIKYTALGSGDDYDSALNVRLTGGDIPDIFQVPNRKSAISSASTVNRDLMHDYVKSNLIMNLKPYLDELKPLLKFTGDPKKPDLYKDGVYLIPVKAQKFTYDTIMVRNDWIKKVGGKVPKTPEDALELCKQFTENDPDGNGKKDTYGLFGAGIGVFNALLYTYDASVNNDIIIRDGKVTSTLLSPYMKDGLKMCKQFVDEKVVDPDLTANMSSDDKAKQGFYGLTAASFAGIMRGSEQKEIKAANPDTDWKVIDALTGPAGKKYGYIDLGNTSTKYVVGKNVGKDKAKRKKVFELLNYLASEEGQNLVCYGIEGRHYNVQDKKIVPTDLMSVECNFTNQYQLCGRDDNVYLPTKFPEWKDLIPFTKKIPEFEVYNCAVTAPEGFYVEDFNKYVTEEMTKFIYGQRPIKEYDKFLDELESTFGFSKYMKVAKEQLKEQGFVK